MKSKLTAIIVTLCMAIAMCLSLVACIPNEKEAQTYVSLDINPSIELTLDSRDKVVSVRGANEDGQVLLYGEKSLVGLDVEEAVAKITEIAIDLGYLDEDNKTVQTNVESDKRADSILSKINANITATADKLNITVSCDGANAYSLARKLDNLKAQYPDNKAIQSLTPSRLKLVVSASETGTISVDAAAELDTFELIAIVSSAHAEMTEYATSAYNKAKTVAEDAYLKVQTATLDAIYTTYFATHHAIDSYYAFAYQGYKLASVTTKALADVLYFAEQACDRPLNEDQIVSVSKALGLGDNVDCLKNSQGEITVRSIEAYADKVFKNSQASAELEQVKAKLTEALNTAESAIQAEIDKFNAKYQTELEQIKDSLSQAKDKMQSAISNLLPNEIKQQIETLTGDIQEIVSDITGIISDGKITADEVRVLADRLEGKASASRSAIDGKLTDEEKEEIASLQRKAEEKLAVAKDQMDEAISKAEVQAKEYLQQLKNQRAGK